MFDRHKLNNNAYQHVQTEHRALWTILHVKDPHNLVVLFMAAAIQSFTFFLPYFTAEFPNKISWRSQNVWSKSAGIWQLQIDVWEIVFQGIS